MTVIMPSAADHPAADTHTNSLYRYFDDAGVLLYVGITSRGMTRNQQHNQGAPWWPLVARQEVQHFGSRDELAKAEVEAIRASRPIFNVQHNPECHSLRAIYYAHRTGVRPSPLEIFQSTKDSGGLPLLRVRDAPGPGLVVRTAIEHEPITHMLKATRDITPVDNGRRVGCVRELWLQDGFAFLRLAGKHLPIVTEARAVLRWGNKPPAGYEVRRVVVTAHIPRAGHA